MPDVFTSYNDKIALLHKRATSILFACSTVFPFDVFPNTLSIDHNKIDITYRQFFGVGQTASIPISNINYVSVEASILFATLRIEVKGMYQNPGPLTFLRRSDAFKAQHLIFGLMSAKEVGIDLSHLPPDEGVRKLIEIGQV